MTTPLFFYILKELLNSDNYPMVIMDSDTIYDSVDTDKTVIANTMNKNQ